MNILDLRKIYFVGIGGIGMSALARYFHQRGVEVSGYDKTESPLTDQLQSEGIAVHFTASTEDIPAQVDLAVFTPAVPSDHPAFRYFREAGIPMMKRAEVLGWISKHGRCVAVAGTHGKTTTTTILAHVLRQSGVDCSAFLGGISANYGTNYLLGKSDWIVVEADEYDRSFLHLYPTILVVNALDPDHLDIYSNEEDMLQTYYQLLRQVRPDGHILLREDLHLPEEVFLSISAKVHYFGEHTRDIRIEDIRQESSKLKFDLVMAGQEHADIAFSLPGKYNAFNAAAAFSVGLIMNLDPELMRGALSSFKGVGRRFDIHVDTERTAYVDDYAHHPVELAGLVQAVRSRFPGRKITAVFQPHLFSRTRDFADAFAAALDQFDHPWLLDIYPAREQPIPGVTTQMLLERMTNPAKRYLRKEELLDAINHEQPDVLVTAGAGDIDRMIPDIIQLLNPTRT